MSERPPSRFRATPMNVIIASVVGVVVFVLVATMRQENETTLEGLSETELVRLLDDVDTRIAELSVERDGLEAELRELRSGADSEAAVAELAAQQEMLRTVQAGIVPVVGPGVQIRVSDPNGQLPAQSLFTLVQELRNAAAEAIEINNVRVVTRTSIVNKGDAVFIDGVQIASPYTIRAIGDSDMMRIAMEMPGGILAAIRSRGPSTQLTQQDSIEILSVAELPDFTYAVPTN